VNATAHARRTIPRTPAGGEDEGARAGAPGGQRGAPRVHRCAMLRCPGRNASPARIGIRAGPGLYDGAAVRAVIFLLHDDPGAHADPGVEVHDVFVVHADAAIGHEAAD
jgi:hypothetical protein